MTGHEWRAALATMPAMSPVQVVLFTHDGTREVFALEDASATNGQAPLEIYDTEDTPASEENPEG